MEGSAANVKGKTIAEAESNDLFNQSELDAGDTLLEFSRIAANNPPVLFKQPIEIIKDKGDKQQKDKRLILTMEDLSKALKEVEYGVNVKHQEYFTDSPSAGLDPPPREK